MIAPGFAAIAAFAAAGLAAWCNRRVIGFLPDDPPRAGRKQHGRPIPIAGIVLVPAVAPWFVASGSWWPLLAMLAAAATGFVDDRRKEHDRDLGWREKALGLTVASMLGAMGVVSPAASPLAFVVIVPFVFVLTNATNFLDNTNGVAASLAATSLLLLSDASGPFAALGCAALGFLPWNWPHARLFLGDSGAYALGVATGIAAADRALVAPAELAAVAVQLVDFVQVVVARLALGLPPWVGDRRHLFHIVQNLGVPMSAVAPLLVALLVLCSSIF